MANDNHLFQKNPDRNKVIKINERWEDRKEETTKISKVKKGSWSVRLDRSRQKDTSGISRRTRTSADSTIDLQKKYTKSSCCTRWAGISINTTDFCMIKSKNMKGKGRRKRFKEKIGTEKSRKGVCAPQNKKHCKKETFLFGFKALRKPEFYRKVSFWGIKG